MIIKEINKKEEERENKKKIFEMLKDVKLPKYYKFVDDCVEIWFSRFLFASQKVASIYLNPRENALIIDFIDEEELNILRNCFKNSKTRFILKVEDWYY